MLSSTESENEILEVVTPAARKIFQILQAEERLHVNEIRARTTYCRRTVQFALSQLLEAELITSAPDLHDMRKKYYRLASA
jgi:predicted transcriptional regulator